MTVMQLISFQFVPKPANKLVYNTALALAVQNHDYNSDSSYLQ